MVVRAHRVTDWVFLVTVFVVVVTMLCEALLKSRRLGPEPEKRTAAILWVAS
jgi:hypothetical protein